MSPRLSACWSVYRNTGKCFVLLHLKVLQQQSDPADSLQAEGIACFGAIQPHRCVCGMGQTEMAGPHLL